MDAWIVESDAPLLALGGIVRPRLVISRGVVGALSAEQLAAALRHERAHWASHDNLKRLCILLTPGILPFAGSSQTLERGWRKFTEWAADDQGHEYPVGQKIFIVDGEEVPLLEMRSLEFSCDASS